MTRWMIIGASGMLGTELEARLRVEGHPFLAFGRPELDLCDTPAVHHLIAACRPHVVVNCAAWNAVDEAETREDEALAVNGTGVRAIAEACGRVGARMIQPSSDYVFDGTALDPYPEDARPCPVNAYGRTKLAGERAVLEVLPRGGYVVRTAWLYAATGHNFVRTMIRLEAEGVAPEVVGDQFGQPTWAGDLAARIVDLAESEAPPGVYHATNSGHTSWYDLAREVFTLLGADPARVREIPSKDLTRPAPRPAYSVLGHDGWRGAGLPPMRHWKEALRESRVLASG